MAAHSNKPLELTQYEFIFPTWLVLQACFILIQLFFIFICEFSVKKYLAQQLVAIKAPTTHSNKCFLTKECYKDVMQHSMSLALSVRNTLMRKALKHLHLHHIFLFNKGATVIPGSTGVRSIYKSYTLDYFQNLPTRPYTTVNRLSTGAFSPLSAVLKAATVAVNEGVGTWGQYSFYFFWESVNLNHCISEMTRGSPYLFHWERCLSNHREQDVNIPLGTTYEAVFGLMATYYAFDIDCSPQGLNALLFTCLDECTQGCSSDVSFTALPLDKLKQQAASLAT